MTERAVRGRARRAQLPDGSPDGAVRRAPFADNPAVGVRGQQAQQRILRAALQVFAEVGYQQCRVHRITELAGCSRVSFYQYFSSKEDVFRHLAGRVARLLGDSLAQLGPIAADEAGRDALVGYFSRYSEIYDEYQPIFVAFQTAASSDEVMAEGGQRIGTRVIEQVQAKIERPSLRGAALDGTVRTIVGSSVRANRLHELIRTGQPPVRLSRERINAALADVSHRALFGVLPGINLRAEARRARAFPREAAAASNGSAKPRGRRRPAPGPSGMQTRAAVLEAGHQVYVERGYYGTRVDDIVKVAGVSHGVFYRYFKNKDELFRLLAYDAAQRFTGSYDGLGALDLRAPDARVAFRAWLENYARTCSEAAAITRVWADAITRDPQLGTDSAAAIRAGCRGIAELLERRGSGDIDAEAAVMLVLLEEMTPGHPSPKRLDSVGRVIERSLLFLDT